MFAHTLIYALEFAVCALFIVLFVQIYRGYRQHAEQLEKEATERAAASAALISARAKASVLGQRKPVSVTAPALSDEAVYKAPAHTEPVQREPVQDVPTLQPVARESVPDVRRQPLNTNELARLAAANNDQVKEPVRASEAILNDYIGEFFALPEKTNIEAFKVEVTTPGVRAAAQVSEDDLVITVNSGSTDKLADDKVMSDKVVHAMLHEAKLVCIS